MALGLQAVGALGLGRQGGATQTGAPDRTVADSGDATPAVRNQPQEDFRSEQMGAGVGASGSGLDIHSGMQRRAES